MKNLSTVSSSMCKNEHHIRFHYYKYTINEVTSKLTAILFRPIAIDLCTSEVVIQFRLTGSIPNLYMTAAKKIKYKVVE